MSQFIRKTLCNVFSCCLKRPSNKSFSNVATVDEVASLLPSSHAVQTESGPEFGSTWNLDLLFSGSYLFQHEQQQRQQLVDGTTEDMDRSKVGKGKKRGKSKKPRPTHFLAVKIDDPGILEAAMKVQSEILEKVPEIQPAVIPVSKLHVTLGVFYLPTQEHVDSVKQSLSSINWSLVTEECNENLSLTVKGVGHFRDQIIWAGLHVDEHCHKLRKIAENAHQSIKSSCPEAVCEEKIDDSFKPHITLAKLTTAKFHKHNKKSESKIRKIDRNSHNHLNDHLFGTQFCNRIQLLAMQWPKGSEKDGYYYIEDEFSVVS